MPSRPLSTCAATRSGRATFLPLDVLRPRASGEKVAEAIGWASDLVEAAPEHRTVTSYLLGRVLLVKDLAVARQVLDRPAMRQVSSIVTLAGDIVRPGGAITGGSATVRSSALLERERELGELPRRIGAMKEEERLLDSRTAAAEATLRQAEQALVALDGRIAGLRSQRAEQAALEAQAQREQTRWQSEINWVRDQQRSLEKTLLALDAEQARLTSALATERQRQAVAQAQATRLRGEIAALASNELAARLAEARTLASLGEQALAARKALAESLHGDAQRLAAQIAAKERRAAEIAAQADSISADIEKASGELRALSRSHPCPARDDHAG